MNESFINISRMCVKSQADPGLELDCALAIVAGVYSNGTFPVIRLCMHTHTHTLYILIPFSI